jgi:hypothetical protein
VLARLGLGQAGDEDGNRRGASGENVEHCDDRAL